MICDEFQLPIPQEMDKFLCAVNWVTCLLDSGPIFIVKEAKEVTCGWVGALVSAVEGGRPSLGSMIVDNYCPVSILPRHPSFGRSSSILFMCKMSTIKYIFFLKLYMKLNV